jgi:hypothetical protein
MKTPLQLAQDEWEGKTQPNPKSHPVDLAGKVVHIHDFRKYGQAIALLNFDSEYIEITKLEKIPGAGRGAAIPLVEFLKAIADKYSLRLYGHATIYIPDPPIPEGPFPTQEELEIWYLNRGFKLRTKGKPAPVVIWYPDVPLIASDDS